MNLREAINPTVLANGNREEQKEALQQTAENALKAIEAQLGDIKKTGKTALIIGGVIVAGYALTRVITSDDEEDETENKGLKKSFSPVIDEKESIIWGALKGIAVSVALGFAKQKVVDVVQNFTKKDEKPSA